MTLSKIAFFSLGAATLVLTGCFGNGGSDTLSVNGAASDGQITQSEAAVLINTRSEVGEPDNLDNVTLQTSETAEPFDL